LRLTRPRVGFRPTMPQLELGDTIEPSVSVPTASVARLAAIAAPEPELEPLVLRSRAWGLRVWPPRPLQPLTEWVERMLAHSDKFVLPMMTAPAARRRSATKASRVARTPSRASEPALVLILSPVAILSFSRTG